MNNNFGLPQRTMNELLNYFETRSDIEKVVIFGSRAKGTYRNGSDIDFAVWSDKDAPLGIALELDELPTPYSFDVINYKTLSNEQMKKNIDEEGQLFYLRK